MSGSKAAATVIVEGVVQGVGFRQFAQRKAAGHGITGYAMNLRNGSVKVSAEGSRESLEAFIKDLEKGPPLARVTSCTVTWTPPSGKYRNFSIRLAEFE